MSIATDELAAYYNMAIVLTAHRLELPVRRVSLELFQGRRASPQLCSPSEYIRRRSRCFNPDESIRDYVTVLLSGAVGRIIGLEANLGYSGLHPEVERLQLAYQLEARLCRDFETDKAYSLIVGSLLPHDAGDADGIIEELWHRAGKILRAPPLSDRLGYLVEEFKTRRVLIESELTDILKGLRF